MSDLSASTKRKKNQQQQQKIDKNKWVDMNVGSVDNRIGQLMGIN